MTKREKMMQESLRDARDMAESALNGDLKASAFLSSLNIKTKGEILSFLSAINFSIVTVTQYSRKEQKALFESKWINPEWVTETK